ncbi:hypothetical protein LTR66_003120 [Elasticomyces elasticus]|nr:hypothetical protein LTR50_002975 [Elasticomyces elasticus]KAK4997460.1 hypothetical protein LTR66_003120 [Elasticomyces elasticus]
MANASQAYPTARLWFQPGAGIAREVITADIQRYLGPDAVVRPGRGDSNYQNGEFDVRALGTTANLLRLTKPQGVEGYWIKAYRNLTTDMVHDLMVDSQRWESERGSGRRGSSHELGRSVATQPNKTTEPYITSHTFQVRQNSRPSNPSAHLQPRHAPPAPSGIPPYMDHRTGMDRRQVDQYTGMDRRQASQYAVMDHRRVDQHAGMDRQQIDPRTARERQQIEPHVAIERQPLDDRADLDRPPYANYGRSPAPAGYSGEPAYPTEYTQSQSYMRDAYYVPAPGHPADQQRNGPTYPTGYGQYPVEDPRYQPGYRDGIYAYPNASAAPPPAAARAQVSSPQAAR